MPILGFLNRLQPARLNFRQSPVTAPAPGPLQQEKKPSTIATSEDHFDRIQATEQMMTYSAGGWLEGLGKFLQRTDRDRYFDHPIASPIFTPFFSAMKFCAEAIVGKDNIAVEIFLKNKIGNAGFSVGNFLKMASSLYARHRYHKLARVSKNEKIIQKASEGNSTRNICYLAEKASFFIAGQLFAFGHEHAAVATMFFSQLATLALVPITLKANWNLIGNFRKNPRDLKVARDASKITFLNLTKGLWSVSTLGLFSYLCFRPASALSAGASDTSRSNLPSAKDLYDILMQNSWELPPALIIAGGILMITPGLIAMTLDARNIAKAPAINGNGETPHADTTPETITKRKIYYGFATTADFFNVIGGFYTASLLFQPLGAIFNGAGSLISYFQSRYKTKHKLG